MTGIYIPGMEMPKDGYVDIRLFSDGKAVTPTGKPPYYCEMPIIEVPAHGRLIDSDAILFECNVARIQPGDSFVLRRDIDNEPTIIPASGREAE